MRLSTHISKVAMAVALSAGVATTALANTGQSSAIRGAIVGPQGNPAVNSTLTVIHQPSGTVKEVTVNEQGQFNARGLRVGGPYTIIVSSEKFEGKVYEDVYLELNDVLQLDAQLAVRQDLETITVTGARDFFSTNGSSSVFGEDDIANAATFNRDLKEVVRLNPLAVVDPSGTSLSVAGSNPKYNNLNIDGVGVNDTFGLNSNGYPAQRPPISLDAVEQVSIDFAPFTARAGNFTGGTINVVTKSGTNELTGSLMYEWVPTTGTAKDDRSEDEVVEYDFDNEETTMAASLGGAFIEDELFFFASYEKWEEDVQFNYDLNTLANHRVTTGEVQEVLTALSDVYGLNDSIGGAPPADSDEKYLIKLDWNVSSDHRADLTYSYQENTAARNFTDSDFTVNLASNAWSQDSETTFVTAHLYSDWTYNLSTELSMSYKDYTQASNTASNWGEINIRTEDGSIVAGQDENRHANVLENETLKIALHGIYLAGDTEYKFGVEMEDLWNYNLYGRDSAGTWSFDSIEDFTNRMPSELEYSNAYTNNRSDIAYDVESTQYSIYGEMNRDLFDGFNLTAGLRYEYLSVGDTPAYNENFESTYGYPNTENMDGVDILLPRIGFSWEVNEDLTVRGGVGRYSGGMPLVWVSNAYTNDGVTKVNAPSSVTDAAISDPSNVDFTRLPQSVLNAMMPGTGSTNTIDPNFEMPSDWRYQIGADYIFDVPGLGDNFAWTTELSYVDRKDSPYWVDLSRVKAGETVEGRTIWESRYSDPDLQDNWDLELTNVDDGGRSIIFTTAVDKAWDNGISMNASYTNQDITEVNPGTSSTAESNYQYEVTKNRNEPLEGTAYYEIEHRLVVNLGYETEFFSGYATNFNLFFERRSGRPFSWTLGAYQESRFGTGFGDQPQFDDSDIYIPYLPSGADDPAFDFSRLSYDELMAIAEQAGVAGYAGDYVPKYSATQPWVTTMDLVVKQEVPGFAEGHKGEVYFIIDNFANLLNDDWGKYYDMRFPQQILVDYGINDQGQYRLEERFGGTDTNNWDTFNVNQSTWQIKAGVKYKF